LPIITGVPPEIPPEMGPHMEPQDCGAGALDHLGAWIVGPLAS